MKKTAFLLAALLLAFFYSCSGDDSTSNVPTEPPLNSEPLVKKMIDIDEKGDTITTKFTYSGNKILTIEKGDGYKTSFTYAENLITNLTTLDENGAVDYVEQYTYVKGKLSSKLAKKTGNKFDYVTEYTHNTNDTVLYSSFSINKETNDKKKYATGTLTFFQGNLISQSYNGTLITYEYDAKNYPFKNVLGFNLLLDNYYPDNLMINNINNVTKTTVTYNSNSFDTLVNYLYNEDSYPKERKCVIDNYGDIEVNTTHFFYE